MNTATLTPIAMRCKIREVLGEYPRKILSMGSENGPLLYLEQSKRGRYVMAKIIFRNQTEILVFYWSPIYTSYRRGHWATTVARYLEDGHVF